MIKKQVFPINYNHENCPFAKGYAGGCRFEDYCRLHNKCKFDVISYKVYSAEDILRDYKEE